MAEAARLADQVSHTYAVVGEIGGAIAGAFLGALVATAVIAATALTGGLALLAFVAIGGVIGAVVHAGAMGLSHMFSSPTGVLGPPCSPNVFVNSRNSARVVLDYAVCSGAPPAHYPPHPYAPIAEGSASVFINGEPAARKGDALVCGAKISQGSENVFIGGATARLLEVEDEVPMWAKIVGFIASIPAGMAGAKVGAALLQRAGAIIAAGTSASAKGAAMEIAELGPVRGLSKVEIEAQLQARGYTPTPANNGGTIWTKACADGNTAAVRIDPPMVRSTPKGFADEVPHVHKEIVPTASVSGGNYTPSSATKLDDLGLPTTDPHQSHIPGGH